MIFLSLKGSLKNLKKRITKRFEKSTFFQDKFGFENGIDITDDNMVLYRKNIVIKNIVFVVNLLYTLIFTIITLGNPSNTSNILLTILLLPVTMLVNYFLGKLINKGPNDNLSQTMAMYVSAFYMFLSSVLVYIKLKYGESGDDGANYLSEAGYILIYISLLMCAFYQNKKMLKNIFIWVLVLITILHFTVTYSLVSLAQNSNIWDTFVTILTGTALRDILVRTILLVAYMLILYIYVAMTNYMQEERKKEQAKRRKVQEDYIKSVQNIFAITLPNIEVTEDDLHENMILTGMVKKLASLLSLKLEEIDELADYTKLIVNSKFELGINDEMSIDDRFNSVRKNTDLGEKLIARLELKRKSEDILRHVLDNASDDDYIKRTRNSLTNINDQIILICEIYISMRSVRRYKKAYNHKNTMATLEKSFKVYFDSLVFDRFSRFDADFEAIYDEE